MTDLARLVIAVDSSSAKDASKDLDKLGSSADKAEGYIGKMGRTMAGLATALGIGVLIQQFVATNQEFQRLSASLVTVTGDVESAQRAFAMIQNFAKTTPYELTELTQAFVDLKTRGMDASVGSLTSYGNMASAFGRSMTDLVRAVSGVAMGESEAIKSFGVQARTEGDRIALTFKGQTEIINRSTSDVEEYFKRLSDANFASGMERQAKTLGGVLSNLRDQVASTFFSIGNAGASDVMVKAVLGLTNALARATPAMADFTARTIQAFTSMISVVDSYKRQIGLAIIVLASMSAATAIVNSTMLASVVAFTAQTARVVALTLAASGFSVSATAAAIAQTTWNAASLSGIAAAGLLAAAIITIYVATKDLREETERLNKEIADSKPWHDRAELHKNFAEETKRIEENVKLMRAAIGGSKGAQDELAVPEVTAYKRNASTLGTEAFDRQVQLRIKAVEEERKLKGELEAQNKALKTQEEYAKKINAEREKINQFGIKTNSSYDGESDGFMYFSLREREAQDIQIAVAGTEDLTAATVKLRNEYAKMKIIAPDTWSLISEVIQQSSGYATDSLVRWMDNLDGVGRSWETLRDTVRNVIADMLIQMQRAIVQQQLMDPLVKWGLTALGGAFTSSNGGSPSFDTGTGNYGDTGFDANYSMANPSGSTSKGGASSGASVSVVINGATGDTKSTVQGGTAMATGLKQVVDGYINEWAMKETRQGGMLARS